MFTKTEVDNAPSNKPIPEELHVYRNGERQRTIIKPIPEELHVYRNGEAYGMTTPEESYEGLELGIKSKLFLNQDFPRNHRSRQKMNTHKIRTRCDCSNIQPLLGTLYNFTGNYPA